MTLGVKATVDNPFLDPLSDAGREAGHRRVRLGRRMRWLLAAGVLSAALASMLAPAPAVAAEFQPVSGPSCQDIALPVSLGDEGSVTAATLDSGWLTTWPKTIGGPHCYRPGAAPRVIAYDETHMDVVSSAEFATCPVNLNAVWSQIHVPVPLIIGTKDIHYCAPDGIDCSSQKSFRDSEPRFFSPDAAVGTILVAFTGHDLTMHVTALLPAALMTAWSRQVRPPRTVNHRPANRTSTTAQTATPTLPTTLSQLDNTIEGET